MASERRGAGAHGIEDDRLPGRACGGACEEHRVNPWRAQSSDVENQGPRHSREFGGFLRSMRHDRRCAQCQQGVRGSVHDDVVGDVVNQRGFGAYALEVLPDTLCAIDGSSP